MGLLLQEWSFQLVDLSKGFSHGGAHLDDDAGALFACNQGRDPDSPTIYTDRNGTTLTETNRVAKLTFTNGFCRFWTASTVTALDIYFMTTNGQCGQLYNVGPGHHAIIVDPARADQLLMIPFFGADNGEEDTGVDLAANLLVTDAWVDITTADSGATISVGILASESGGDADGFLATASVASAAVVGTAPSVTAGTAESFLAASDIGALLGTFLAGTNVATDVGTWVKNAGHKTDGTAKSITYTGSATDFSAEGFILLQMKKLSQA